MFVLTNIRSSRNYNNSYFHTALLFTVFVWNVEQQYGVHIKFQFIIYLICISKQTNSVKNMNIFM